MGFFDKINKVMNAANQVKDMVESTIDSDPKLSAQLNKITGYRSETTGDNSSDSLIMAAGSHQVVEEVFDNDDRKYQASIMINDSFKQARSHAAEVEMLNTYAPDAEYGEEGDIPYFAVQSDDKVYRAVDEFKRTGTISSALEVTSLTGKFYFKAKINYANDIMYFYGLDRCGGSIENNGLCMVYKKSMLGSADEQKLMKVLDDIADSYAEECLG